MVQHRTSMNFTCGLKNDVTSAITTAVIVPGWYLLQQLLVINVPLAYIQPKVIRNKDATVDRSWKTK